MLRYSRLLLSPGLEGLSVKALSPGVGLLVDGGVQLPDLREEQLLALRNRFVSSHSGVLLARRQRLETEGAIRQAARAVSCGSIDSAVQLYVTTGRRGTPEGDLPRGSDFWHQDKSYLPEPGRFGALYAVKVPPDEGDTLFANLVRAWEDLDEKTKEAARGLHAWYYRLHNCGATHRITNKDEITGELIEHKPGDVNDIPRQRHPFVTKHPISQQEACLLSPCYLQAVDVPPGPERKAAEQLIHELTEHALQPRFTYRHRWRPGDILFWDNHIVMHRAQTIDMSPEVTRIMYRMEFRD
eukprot:TRINITY_DN72849_c0_g1_i1.p1 TRINITY_DN72849_c0_g1~~TRINITY_DN72849_c0_g1_i1.p1  ORF type:complete len:298 (+),score=47.34 TRINITY_DN72849_c0_g1_i1:223-1116(+)